MPQQNRMITQFPQLPVVTGSEFLVCAYDPSPNYKLTINQLAAFVGTPSSSLLNPMNATGDMIVGGGIVGGFAVPSRLGIGLNGQVLKAVAGLPTWSTLATVATTGAYSDLSGAPAVGSVGLLNLPGGTTTFLRADGTFALPATTVPFGSVTGAVSTNANLQAALDLKQNRSPTIQSVASAATVTPTFANDAVYITAQATGLTLANPTGTAIDGLGIVIRIKDNGIARSIAYGAQYRAIGVTLPTTTVINKTLYLGMIFNQTDTTWDVCSVAQQA